MKVSGYWKNIKKFESKDLQMLYYEIGKSRIQRIEDFSAITFYSKKEVEHQDV